MRREPVALLLQVLTPSGLTPSSTVEVPVGRRRNDV